MGILLGLYLLILNQTLNISSLTYEIMSKLKINSKNAEYALRYLIKNSLGNKRLDVCNSLMNIFEKNLIKIESIHLIYLIIRIFFNGLNDFHQLVLNNDFQEFIMNLRPYFNKLYELEGLLNEVTQEQSSIIYYIYSKELLNETNVMNKSTKIDLILYNSIIELEKCNNSIDLTKFIIKFNENFNLAANSTFAKLYCNTYLINFKEFIQIQHELIGLNKSILNKYCANSFELCVKLIYFNQLNSNSFLLFNNMKYWLLSLNIMPFVCRKQTFYLWRQLLIICKKTNNKELIIEIKQFFSKYLLNEFGLQFDVVSYFLSLLYLIEFIFIY